ncbi:MAG: HAMP domain-containing sensor histidine kinase [Hyphomicrobiaceae bacterium]|nr:HAMP domain-containing sensor histidine kinase [Hyphomicrobiaceae bacterium]
MIGQSASNKNTASLMSEYASMLGTAVLRNRAYTAEQAARIETELANRVKSEFISNMSHELRTPLNTVIGFSKILTEHGRRPIDDASIVEYASLIHDAAAHLLSVINDILDISKMRSGRYTLDAHEVDVSDVLRAVVAALAFEASSVQVEIATTIPAELPPVRGDEGKLSQVFTNLLSNAIKFTPPGGRVVIEATRLPDEGTAVLIRDTGVGMGAEELGLALEPFGQVDGSRTRWREGTGLGLPIAKSLIELHGGRLEIRSQKGVGTDVAVVLPSRHRVSLAQGRVAAMTHVR